MKASMLLVILGCCLLSQQAAGARTFNTLSNPVSSDADMPALQGTSHVDINKGTRDLLSACSWAGHCLGDPCSDYNDCDGDLICTNGQCSSSTSGPTPTPTPSPTTTTTCSWPGHCLGASCSTYNDCDGDLICTSGKCSSTSSGPTPTTPTTQSGNVLLSGTATGTYYYDVHGNYCPQDSAGYPENNGYPACASYTPGSHQLTLSQLNSDNVIAIDNNVLSANRAKYCGKKVIVTHNGVRVSAPDGGDFFVWDGCQACIGGGRIDFSVSGLQHVDPNACNLGLVPGVSYQVVDTVVKQFVA